MRKFIQIYYRKPSRNSNEGGFSISGKLKQIRAAFESNSKFTIHPFRSLHSKHLLPLSPTDYVARFGLELVIIAVTIFAVVSNLALASKSNDYKDSSVVFSFLSENPKLNSSLIAAGSTSTITASADQWISKAQASDGVVLTSAVNTISSTPTTIQDNVIVKTNPADTTNLRHGKTTYEVQSGDNLVSIASSFGISPATIIKENNLDASGTIKPGQDLSILPVEGISYTLKEGDDLEAIAKKYNADLDNLLEVNDLELASDAQPGATIIIPTKVTIPSPTAPKKFVNTTSGRIQLTQATAPADLEAGELAFIWPTVTHQITQGFSSRHSGIDISDSKMEAIYAAESGFVEIAGFQTNGYGNTIVINHGGGFKTRYGHASELYVKAGDYVTKGQLIAKQGRTGNVRGITGIHLHFEILKNGIHINPLLYDKP